MLPRLYLAALKLLLSSTPIPLHVNITPIVPTPVRGDVVTITRWRCDPRAWNPDIGATTIVEPMAVDPDGISAGRSGQVHPSRWGWRCWRLRDDNLGGRLIFRSVKGALLVIEAVANCTAEGCARDAADDSPARGVAVTAVVADDGASYCTHHRTANGSLLGVGSYSDTAAKKHCDTK